MKIRLIESILFCLFVFAGNADTDKYRIIITDDPSTKMTIAWNQGALGTNPVVYYDVIDHGTDHTLYTFSKTEDRAVIYKGMDNRFVRLSGLTPNTNYYFIIKDSQSTSQRFWFKTAPSDNSRLSFISGGDSRNNRVPRQNANLLVSKLKPHAVLFGGDMTDDDTSTEWQDWFDDWQLTTASDGRMFPIVPTRGNHEDDVDGIYKLFDTPNIDSYYAVTFGNNLVRTYTLNTEISVLGNQLTWLQNDLAASSTMTWKMAQYHKPMRPHTASKAEGNSQYTAWAQLFYDEEVRLVVECDSHMSKTTYPVMPSSAIGNDEGFINEPLYGTVYTGEGCWGAPIRPNDDLKSWTRNSGSFNQFKLIFVDTETIELRTIKVNNAASVGENSNSDPFTLPTNLDVFTPSPGEDVVYIYKDPPCTITDITVGAQGTCNSADDTYTQDLTITYVEPPTTGFLEVNNQQFAITTSPQTITLTELSADGLDVNVTASFTDDNACIFTRNNVFEAPSKCSTGGVPDNVVDETISLALITEATVSGNVSNGRGIPEHILYDPATNDYAITTNYNEYGVDFGENLGTPSVDDSMKWQVNWPNNKSINYITFGGVYSNQPQPNTMWRISYRNSGVWTTLEQGQGGWIDSGIYTWGGPAQTPIVADAFRIQLYSDGTNEVESIHLRGRGGISTVAGDDTDTTPKATVIQYLSLQESCNISSIPSNTQLYCYDKWQNGNGMTSTTASENFIISNGTVTINEDENVAVNDLELYAEANLIIKEGGSLTVNGNLINNGSVELNSISTKYSSLIVKGTSSGLVTYKRHVNAFGANNDLITTPVKNQNFENFANGNPNLYANPNLNDQKLFGPFDKTAGEYDTYFTMPGSPDLNVTLGNGTAYRTARDSSLDGTYGTTFDFTGEVVTDDVQISIIESGINFKNWNLIGNPFSSYLDFGLFFDTNKLQFGNAEFQAIYGYDGDASDGWRIWNNLNASDLIAPGQGFFVYAKTGGGTVNFTESMMTIGNSDDFILGRPSSTSSNQYKASLKMMSGNSNFITDVYFTNQTTSDLDPGYDAALFGDNPPEFSIYSRLLQNDSGIPLAIQALNSNAIYNVTVPLGVKALANQSITISLVESNLPSTITIYLDDIENNTSTLLTTNDYTFTTNSILDSTNRFYLRFTDNQLSTSEKALEELTIYADHTNESILVIGQLNEPTTFRLYNIQGKVMKSVSLDQSINRQSIDIGELSKGIYLVELKSSNNSKRIKKLIIR